MTTRLAMLLLPLTAAAASAQPAPPTEVVVLSNFNFQPSTFELHAGVPVVLALRNASGSGHSFSAPSLLGSARLSPASAALVRDGRVEVPAHSERDVTITPVAGRYPFKCSHMFHAMLGMTGTVIVR